MKVQIDHIKARNALIEAISEVLGNSWTPQHTNSIYIERIIMGSHKTYRYILLTGILAKTTNGQCNPLVLQAGSSLDGAFDARSLCHSVVVPIERELLGGRLGASNEPYLNKPARFTELSKDNAVRAGKDLKLLRSAIYLLSNLIDENDAEIALKDSIYWTFQREGRDFSELLALHAGSISNSSYIVFASNLIKESHEGETCALLSGVSFEILNLAMNKDLKIVTHKVNQAGSSSKEVSDVDIYQEDNLFLTAEVKDKDFSRQDVEHAISKVLVTGHMSLIFLKGPRGKLIGSSESDIISEWSKKGFSIYFINLFDYFASVLSCSQLIPQETFIQWLTKHTEDAKLKDDTVTYVKSCLANQKW